MDPIIIFVLVAGLAFAFKHFLGDGVFQSNYQYANKGKWGHPGGLIHSGIHGVLTIPCVIVPFYVAGIDKPFWYISLFAGLIALCDFMVHYLIDLTKVRLTEAKGWAKMTQFGQDEKSVLTVNDNKFFIALMADQCLHFATYVTMIMIMMAIALHTPQI